MTQWALRATVPLQDEIALDAMEVTELEGEVSGMQRGQDGGPVRLRGGPGACTNALGACLVRVSRWSAMGPSQGADEGSPRAPRFCGAGVVAFVYDCRCGDQYVLSEADTEQQSALLQAPEGLLVPCR